METILKIRGCLILKKPGGWWLCKQVLLALLGIRVMIYHHPSRKSDELRKMIEGFNLNPVLIFLKGFIATILIGYGITNKEIVVIII